MARDHSRRCFLHRSLAAWQMQDFESVFAEEVAQLDIGLLPLQQGLAQGSVASKRHLRVRVLGATATTQRLDVRAGIFYTGILPGCACSDDVAPEGAFPEYCDVLFSIDRETAETDVSLL